MIDSLGWLTAFLVTIQLHPTPIFIDGKVVAVLPNDRVTVSVGAKHGAWVGMRMSLISATPKARWRGDNIALIQVGASQSTGEYRPLFLPGPFEPRNGDWAFWTSPWSQLVPRQPIELPGRRPWLEPGGALIDLTPPGR